MNGGLVRFTRMSPNCPSPSMVCSVVVPLPFPFDAGHAPRDHGLVSDAPLEAEDQPLAAVPTGKVEVSTAGHAEGDQIAGLIVVLESRSLSEQGHVIRSCQARTGSRQRIARQVAEAERRPIRSPGSGRNGRQAGRWWEPGSHCRSRDCRREDRTRPDGWPAGRRARSCPDRPARRRRD